MSEKSGQQGSLIRVSHVVVLKNAKGEVLFLKHRGGKWLFPGGRLKVGEKWIDGLHREVEEETGIKNFEITKVLEVDSWDHGGEPHYGVFFLAETGTTEVTLSDEHIDSLWTADPDQIDKLDFWNPALSRIAKSALGV